MYVAILTTFDKLFFYTVCRGAKKSTLLKYKTLLSKLFSLRIARYMRLDSYPSNVPIMKTRSKKHYRLFLEMPFND